MIVKVLKKSYSDNSIEAINENDISEIRRLTEEYSTEELMNVLNEYRYHDDVTGGGTVGQVKGLVKSIPSLAISSFISLPGTLIAALGALSIRFQKRWEDKKSWLNSMRPQYWAEYLANPAEIKGDGTGGSLVDKAVAAPVVLAGAMLKNKRMMRTKDGMKKWWKEEKNSFKDPRDEDSSIKGSTTLNGIDSSTEEEHQQTSQQYTPQQLKNMTFKEYWVKFSNGEIVRFRADSDDDARIIAKAYVNGTRNMYDKLNNRISNGYPKIVVYFDDGEILHWSADNNNTAKKEVIQTRIDLTKAANATNASLMKLQDLSVPKVSKCLVRRNSKIELPDPSNFEISTTQPNNHKLMNTPKNIYQLNKANQYLAKHTLFAFVFPSDGDTDAKTIANEIIRTEIVQKIVKNASKGYDVYKVEMGDNDVYCIPASSNYDATELAKELSKKKIEVTPKFLSRESAEDYRSAIDEYGESITTPKKSEKLSAFDVKKILSNPAKSLSKMNSDGKTYTKVA